MHKILTTAVASVLLTTSAVVTGAAAESRDHSRFNQQDRVVQDYCRNHYDSSCRDWNHNRKSWNESHYRRWYREHSRRHDFRGDDALAGAFGFAAGAIAGSVTNGADGSHVAACEDRYRSYDRRTDTYLGYDGARHYCTL